MSVRRHLFARILTVAVLCITLASQPYLQVAANHEAETGWWNRILENLEGIRNANAQVLEILISIEPDPVAPGESIRVFGYVMFQQNPVPHAKVEIDVLTPDFSEYLDFTETSTDVNGYFEATLQIPTTVPPGEYWVGVTAESTEYGSNRDYSSFVVGGGPPPPPTALQVTVSVDPPVVSPGESLAISGYVLSQQNPIPQARVEIKIDSWIDQTQTDSNGYFVLVVSIGEDASPGTYQVVATASVEGSTASATAYFTIEAGVGPSELAVTLDVEPKVAKPGDAIVVSGRVLSGQTAVPYANLEVEVVGLLEPQLTQADSNGFFRLQITIPINTFPRTYWVSVSAYAEGFTSGWGTTDIIVQEKPLSPDITVTTDKTEYSIGERVRISGEIRVDSRPVQAANVYIAIFFPGTRQAIDEIRTTSDSRGYYAAVYDPANLVEGKYGVFSYVEVGPYWAEAETYFTVVLAEGLEITCSTYDETGLAESQFYWLEEINLGGTVNPPVDAKIFLNVTGPRALSFVAYSSQGKWSFGIPEYEPLPTGRYTVTAVASYHGYKDATCSTVFDIVYPPSKIIIETSKDKYYKNELTEVTVRLLYPGLEHHPDITVTITRPDGTEYHTYTPKTADREGDVFVYSGQVTFTADTEGTWRIEASSDIGGGLSASKTVQVVFPPIDIDAKAYSLGRDYQWAYLGEPFAIEGEVVAHVPQDSMAGFRVTMEITIPNADKVTVESVTDDEGQFQQVVETTAEMNCGKWIVELWAEKGSARSPRREIEMLVKGGPIDIRFEPSKYAAPGKMFSMNVSLFSRYTGIPVKDVEVNAYLHGRTRALSHVGKLDGKTEWNGVWHTGMVLPRDMTGREFPDSLLYVTVEVSENCWEPPSRPPTFTVPIVELESPSALVFEVYFDKDEIYEGDTVTLTGKLLYRSFIEKYLQGLRKAGAKEDVVREANADLWRYFAEPDKFEPALVSIRETVNPREGENEKTFQAKLDSEGSFSTPVKIYLLPSRQYLVWVSLDLPSGAPWSCDGHDHCRANGGKYFTIESRLLLEISPKHDIRAVAADGESSIDLVVKVFDTSGTPLKGHKVYVGIDELFGAIIDLKTGTEAFPEGVFLTEDDGSFTVRYRAPLGFSTYLPKAFDPNLGYVTVTVRATDEDVSIRELGKGRRAEIKIRVYEPPVLLVHGVFSSSETWTKPEFNTYEALKSRGFAAFTMDYTFYQDIYVSARRVGERIESIKKNCIEGIGYVKAVPPYENVNVTKVSIVAHSLGGVVSRVYTLGFAEGGYHNDVLRLVTLGSPHHGSDWTTLAKWQENLERLTKKKLQSGPVYDQLRTESDLMKRLNGEDLRQDRINKDVAHFVIAGTKPEFGWLGWEMLDKPNDGVVTLSGTKLRGVPVQTYHVVHTALTADPAVTESVILLLRNLTPSTKIAYVAVRCPVAIHVYDSEGRHTGRISEEDYVTEIPQSYIMRDEDGDYEQIMVFDANDAYTFVAEAVDSGNFNLTAMFQQDDKHVNLEYSNVPVASGSMAELRTASTDYVLQVDENGDGTTDSDVVPTYSDVRGEQPPGPPTTAEAGDLILGFGILLTPVIAVVLVGWLLIKRRRARKAAVPTAEPPTRYCAECGKPIPVDATFCEKCGRRVQEP